MKHRTRYHSFDAHVSCTCGWTAQANTRADAGLLAVWHVQDVIAAVSDKAVQ